ncbi:MAG TPA: RnfABCDGE type electron transport complex subunit C [Bacilli bacterium]
MIFRKSKGLHISEYQGHKELSLHNEPSDFLKPEFIYIPLIESGAPCDCLVKEGDKVDMGQVVAMRTGRFGLPLHASVSGEVTSINKKMWHTSGKMVPMIEIKNDFQERKASTIKPNDVDSLTREDIIKIARECGIVGLGGAAFPSYVKYNSPNPITTVIVNAAECEPFITTDYTLIKTQPDKLLRGIKYVMRATGASEAYIAIKETKVAAIEVLENNIKDSNIHVFKLKDVYPAGWEKYIVERVMKKTYKGLPSDVGAVVNNVATLIALADAIEFNMPLIEKLVTFTGYGLQNPQNVYVKIGSVVNEVIESIGGYNEGVESAYLLAGGPMMGSGMMFDSFVINRSLNSVLVLPKLEEAEEQPCLGCGKCCSHCPTFLSPILIKNTLEAKDEEGLVALRADRCIECGVCSYVCPSRIELTAATSKSRGIVLSKGRK